MKNLTNRQDLFAKHYATGKSGKQSAILAGYSAKSAEVIASENLRKPEVLKKVEVILNAAGLSDEALAKRLQKAIDSGLGKRASNADALKGIRIAMELKDRFPDNHTRMEVTQTSEIQMELSTKTPEELEEYLETTLKKTQELVAKLKKRREDTQKVGEVKIMETKEVSLQPIAPNFPKAVGISIPAAK